jgi:amidase
VLRGKVFAAMADFFERYDVLVAPVSQVQPFPVDVEHPNVVDGRQMNSYIEWMRSCSRLSITACPALSVPAGFSSDGLPIGLQLVGPYRGEWPLLQVGHMVEVALGAARCRPPVVQPSSS